jgi:hypothetical protein
MMSHVYRNGSEIEPALWTAASQGQLEEVRHLLMGGAYIEEKGGLMTSTPLHEAARLGHEEVVRVLLEYGANVYAKQTDGATPLHVALDYATGQTFLNKKTMKRLRSAYREDLKQDIRKSNERVKRIIANEEGEPIADLNAAKKVKMSNSYSDFKDNNHAVKTGNKTGGVQVKATGKLAVRSFSKKDYDAFFNPRKSTL